MGPLLLRPMAGTCANTALLLSSGSRRWQGAKCLQSASLCLTAVGQDPVLDCQQGLLVQHDVAPPAQALTHPRSWRWQGAAGGGHVQRDPLLLLLRDRRHLPAGAATAAEGEEGVRRPRRREGAATQDWRSGRDGGERGAG